MNAQKHTFAIIVFFAATFIIFGKSLSYDFLLWDDGAFITHNDLIRDLSISNLKNMLTDQSTSIVVPTLWLSLAVDYYFYQLDPWGFSMTNLVLHSLNMFLVFYLFRFFIDKNKYHQTQLWLIAIALTLIWGVHPLRVESVVWISERRDVLSAFFCLLSLLCYFRYAPAIASKDSFLRNETSSNSKLYKYLSIVLFLLALGAKPSVVPYPVVLVLLDFFPLNRLKFSKNIVLDLFRSCMEKWVFFTMSAISAFLTLYSHHGNSALKTVDSFPFEHRFTNAVYSISQYITQTLFPIELVPFYHMQTLSALNPMIICSLLLLGIALFFVIRTAIKKSHYSGITCCGAFIAMVFPILGFFQAGQQGAGDRFTYLATIPFFYVLGWCLLNSGAKKWIWISLAIWTPLLIAKTIDQQDVWENDKNFLEVLTEVAPYIFAANHNKLGLIYAHNGEWDKAEKQFLCALKSQGDPVKWAGSAFGLAHVYSQKNELDKVEIYYKKSIEHDPIYHEAYNELGDLYFKAGHYKEALDPYKKAASILPNSGPYLFDLGNTYFKMGLHKKAINSYNQVLSISPEHIGAYVNLANSYIALNRHDDAIPILNKALQIDPSLSSLRALHKETEAKLKNPSQ